MPAFLVLILFGILQGLTEFLPVSSSGHLSIFQYFAKSMDDDLSLNIAAHIGTLMTVILYYRKDIYNIFNGLTRRDPQAIDITLALIVGSIPTAVLGLLFKKKLGWAITNPVVAAVGLLFTGALLLVADRFKGNTQFASGFGVSKTAAFVVGLVQGFAVFPGISRSGSTIVTGLYLGMSPSNAARFSFLLSLPAIAGAGVLEFSEVHASVNWSHILIGVFVSFITGLLAIHWMVRLTEMGKLRGFASYVFIVSIVFLGLYGAGIGENSL